MLDKGVYIGNLRWDEMGCYRPYEQNDQNRTSLIKKWRASVCTGCIKMMITTFWVILQFPLFSKRSQYFNDLINVSFRKNVTVESFLILGQTPRLSQKKWVGTNNINLVKYSLHQIPRHLSPLLKHDFFSFCLSKKKNLLIYQDNCKTHCHTVVFLLCKH